MNTCAHITCSKGKKKKQKSIYLGRGLEGGPMPLEPVHADGGWLAGWVISKAVVRLL